MIVPTTESFLKPQIRRLKESGQTEEAQAVLRKFLEMDRQSVLDRVAALSEERDSNVIHLPLLRPLA